MVCSAAHLPCPNPSGSTAPPLTCEARGFVRAYVCTSSRGCRAHHCQTEVTIARLQVMPTSASTGFIECIESTPLAVVLAEHKGDIKGFLRCPNRKTQNSALVAKCITAASRRVRV